MIRRCLAAVLCLAALPAGADDAARRVEGPALFRQVCLDHLPELAGASGEMDGIAAASKAAAERELDLAQGSMRFMTAGPMAVALRLPDRETLARMDPAERARFETDDGPQVLTDACAVAAFDDRRTMLLMVAQASKAGEPLQLPNFMSIVVPEMDRAERQGVEVTIDRTTLGDGRTQWRREIRMDGIARIWTVAVELR